MKEDDLWAFPLSQRWCFSLILCRVPLARHSAFNFTFKITNPLTAQPNTTPLVISFFNPSDYTHCLNQQVRSHTYTSSTLPSNQIQTSHNPPHHISHLSSSTPPTRTSPNPLHHTTGFRPTDCTNGGNTRTTYLHSKGKAGRSG